MIVRCHTNQLRARHSNAPQIEINIPGNVFVPTIPDNVTSESSETTPVSPVLNREPITSTHVAWKFRKHTEVYDIQLEIHLKD